MFDRYLNEASTVDGYQLEDGSGVLLLEGAGNPNNVWVWENPQRRRPAGEMSVAVNLILTVLAVAAVAPFDQPDWQVPRWRAYPSDLRTFLNPIELQLIGQDTVYGAPGQVPAYDYQNPRARAYPSDLRTWLWGGQSTTLAPTPQSPFAMLDWAVPRERAYPSDLRTFVVPLQLVLLGQAMYGEPGQVPVYEMPYPRGAAYPGDLRTFFNQPTLLPLSLSADGTFYVILARRFSRR